MSNESPKIVLVPGENPGVSNADYHAEKEHLSSSNVKDMLTNPGKYYEEKILGNKAAGGGSHLLIGSLTHTLILEPEKVNEEYAFFPGFRKAGKEFEQFKIDNPNKSLVSAAQLNVAERLAKSIRSNSAAIELLKEGIPELSLASRILDVPVKCRPDKMNKEKGYIVDIKTTSHPTDLEAFKETIKQFRYDLSAALYCQIAFNIYGKLFDFYFVVVSKADLGCQVYKCSSKTLSEGAADMTHGLVVYKKCLASGIWNLTKEQNPVIISEEILEV